MMARQRDADNIIALYEQKKDQQEINPFELDSRILEVMRAVPREKLGEITEQRENEEEDKRNRKHLYYGIRLKEAEVASEEDKLKREEIFKLKKESFKENPNLHVSETS